VSSSLVCLGLHGARALELGRAVAPGASELDLTGLGGALLVAERSVLERLLAELAARGAVIGTEGDWPAVRITGGVGQFGIDYGPADNPHEAGLDRRAIAWNKGCYLGQETVFMQDARGRLKRRLSLLSVAGQSPPAPGEPVLDAAGQKVGEVTSSAVGGSGGTPLALARVNAPAFQPGTTLTVAGQASRVLDPQALAKG